MKTGKAVINVDSHLLATIARHDELMAISSADITDEQRQEKTLLAYWLAGRLIGAVEFARLTA